MIFDRAVLVLIVLMTAIGTLYDLYKKEENQSEYSKFKYKM